MNQENKGTFPAAKDYQRPLKYSFDASLRKGKGAFYYVFNEGELKCSEAANRYGEVCFVSPNEVSAVAREQPSFIYLDCGAWADNVDGKGTKRRDFGLVCGRNVYLCQMRGDSSAPVSSVKSVKALFESLASRQAGVEVLQYALAKDTAPETADDPALYLFIPDSHIPPVTWFYSQTQLGMRVALGDSGNTPPAWIVNTPAWRRQPDYLLSNYYGVSQADRERGSLAVARGPLYGNPDIFQFAGSDLVKFLDALGNCPSSLKTRLHVVHLGDLFELWLGRDYQFEPGDRAPMLKNGGANRVANWALEVMIQNINVFEAFRRLDAAGMAEVSYLWGNHDAYMKERAITDQIDIPHRVACVKRLHGDIFCEHGHRFDRSNYDNADSGWFSGPWGANMAYNMPVFRKFEAVGRAITGVGHPEEVDGYLLGATLMFLGQKYDEGKKPFSIYVQGHTHARKLYNFKIRTDYHLYAQP